MMQNDDVTTEWKENGQEKQRERERLCGEGERERLCGNAISMPFVSQMESMMISRHIASAASKQMDDNNSQKKRNEKKTTA